MKKKVEISPEEVQQALKKFQEKGGLIKKLPDQVAIRSNMVGSKWAMFELVGEKGIEAEAS